MDIKNPRRILAVSLADSTHHLTRVIKDLTGTHPEQTSTSLAGSSHSLSLKTAYYTAEVPIWLDLISSPSEWTDSFLSAEAKEVLEVLGGLMIVFSLPTQQQPDENKAARELIRHVGRVVKEGLGGWSWDGVGLCLGVGEVDDVDEWEDCCAEWGLEFVQVRNQSVPGRNEFGGTLWPLQPPPLRCENVRGVAHHNTEKTGIPRALEALESNDWAQASVDDLSDLGNFEAEFGLGQDADTDAHEKDGPDLDPESLNFGFDREDFAGLRRAIWNAEQQDNEEDFLNGEPSTRGKGNGKDVANEDNAERLDDEEIRKIERMMVKLQAVRDTSAGLPEEQRKKVAAKAVAEVMKEL
ncbi:hypothetical protein AAE478_005096 [Parahypoxylon ruwenzoriense]